MAAPTWCLYTIVFDRDGFLTLLPNPNLGDQDFMLGFTLLGELVQDELGHFHKILYVLLSLMFRPLKSYFKLDTFE